jgi:hypothetical protein
MIKYILVAFALFLQFSPFLFGQEELKAKLNNNKVDFIYSIDSLSDGSCMVTAQVKLAMTSGGFALYYLHDGKVEKVNSGHTVNYYNRGRYIKSGESVYRIRIEPKNKQYQYFADKLVDLKFEEPEEPFAISDKQLNREIAQYDDEVDYLYYNVDELATIRVLFFDAPNFTNAKQLIDELTEKEAENNLHDFLIKTDGEISFGNIIKIDDDDEATVLIRNIKKEGVQRNEYKISFDFKIASILNAYLIKNELFVLYIDEYGNLHFENFLQNNNVFQSKSESDMDLQQILSEYRNKDLKKYLTILPTITYELFTYENSRENVHILQMVGQNNRKMDFLIFKLVDHKIIWASAIPRGEHVTTIEDDVFNKQFFNVTFDASTMIIEDTESAINYDENGEFLKADVLIGYNSQFYKTQIIINLEDGTFNRKRLN